LPEVLHRHAMRLMRTYMLVGGMPAAVQAWIDKRSFAIVAEMHRDMLLTMRDDFAKYAAEPHGHVDTARVAKVFAALPRLVGRKFMPSTVDGDEKSAVLKHAYRLLALSRVLTPVLRTRASGIPLGADIDDRYCKTCMLDVGLFATMCGVDAVEIGGQGELDLVNAGQLAEQLVGQELRACRHFNQEPELYTWIREARTSNAEVDYVIQVGSRVVPVEVKAGASGWLRSMHAMVSEKNLDLGVRVSSEPLQLNNASTAARDGASRVFSLLSVPFYLASEIPRLVAAIPRSP
jgi:predicted AAA+ superfamily ATPase